MRNIPVLLLVVFICFKQCYCQDALPYQSKWQTNPSFGINFPVARLLNDHPIDNLFQYRDNSIYWQIFSGSYFFSKHWGVGLNIHGMSSAGISKRADNFLNAVESEYSDNFYVTPATGASYHVSNPITGYFERVLFSLIYRYEKGQWFVYPRFLFGVNSFRTNWGSARLKQKNSNNIFEVLFDSGERPADFFIMATSGAFGYKLSKRFYINFDLMISYYNTNIIFTKTTTDLNTNTSISEDRRYIKDIVTLSTGVGIVFVIK